MYEWLDCAQHFMCMSAAVKHIFGLDEAAFGYVFFIANTLVYTIRTQTYTDTHSQHSFRRYERFNFTVHNTQCSCSYNSNDMNFRVFLKLSKRFQLAKCESHNGIMFTSFTLCQYPSHRIWLRNVAVYVFLCCLCVCARHFCKDI